ncbi:enoyl-CoA hydratase/isomerase family protein [Flavihumibacter petaseus]|uniref:Putative enoyl-CoA hydratase n=1 Tax=Flavihumibacter petaseus NBRC 106054 TaxID=1220578 RepID=A0A0E9MXI0_9BACT|nr:enoyl-CoA hydratase/isomerase family protein [Flavihumibacter petaseus]GAO42407.1 putative enoyl-CoA hydratase [Flavihumibacter petaseus NBRC 106054]
MIHESKGGYVKSEIHKGIATVEFFHPQGNSLPGSLLRELAKEIHSHGNNNEVRVILLRSGGDTNFCAGASFEELSNIKSVEEGTTFFNGFAQLINIMRKVPKLIVGRIHGKCVGGGVGLAAAVDYAIAVESAEIRLSELAIGIGPFVVGPAVERKIGLSAFTQLAIDSALWRNGDWARRKGLFAELHPNVDSMDESVLRLTNTLAASSPEATGELKKIFWKGTEHWDQLLSERAAISGRLIVTEHARAAVSKFKAKVKVS